MTDFFVSYNRADRQWAEWIAWILEEAGYSVLIQAWDFRPGGNFVLDMQRAAAESQKTIAVLSETYLQSAFTQPEWAAAFADDPEGLKKKLLPIRVKECQPTGILRPIVHVDLVGLSEVDAKQAVLDALQPRGKPDQQPGFPGTNGSGSQTPHIKCDLSRKANQHLFPNSVLSKNTAQKTENDKHRTTQRKGKKSALSLKNDAFKAEKMGQFEVAKQLWFQILDDFPLEREAVIKSIDRIATRLASQSLLLTSLEAETQLTSNTKAGTNILLMPQLGIKDEVNQHHQEFIVPFVSGTQSFEFEVITVDANGKENNRHQKQAQCLIEKLNGVALEMLVIPGGTFLMGSSERKPLPNELPTRWVTVKPFLLSRYPITKEQWKEIAKLPKVHQELKLRPSIRGSKSSPVVQISWYEAIEFCNRLTQGTGYNYSLPTEAEWEYACRAGTQTPFHFGETITSDLANYDGSRIYRSEQKGINREKLMPVCSFPFANAFGLHEMHGNIWEWCLDSWHENYEDAPEDGKAWMNNGENVNHVVRGGAWLSGPTLCRSTSRASDSANNRSNTIGFRIARSIK